MSVLSMDGLFARGGTVALLTIGAALPLGAQGSGGGTGPVRRDTVVRAFVTTARFPMDSARMDSIRALMRLIGQQAPLSDQSLRLRQELDAMVQAMAVGRGPRIFFDREREGRSFLEIHNRGYIGITTGDAPMKQDPSGVYLQYFAHPAIVSIDRDSPAQAAGILVGDSLIAYDGVDVVGRMLNLNQMLMPDRKLGITVRRAGENRDYQVTVARAPMTMFLRQIDPDDPVLSGERVERVNGRGTATGGVGGQVRVGGRGTMATVVGGAWSGEPGMRGGGFTISSNGIFGARMTNLDPPAAKALSLQPGVLVQDVPEATVAAKAGLLPGDIIIAVGGQSIMTFTDLRSATSRAEHGSVTFQVIRDKKPRTVTIVWGTPTSP